VPSVLGPEQEPVNSGELALLVNSCSIPSVASDNCLQVTFSPGSGVISQSSAEGRNGEINFLSSQFSTLTASHNGKIYRQANDMAEETAQNFCCHVSSSPFSPVLFWSDQTRRRLQLQLQPLLPYFRSLALDFYSISAVAPRLQLNKLESSPPD